MKGFWEKWALLGPVPPGFRRSEDSPTGLRRWCETMVVVTQLFRSYGDVVTFVLLALPVAVLCWWPLSKWRGDRWRAAGDVVLAVSCLPVTYLVLVPTYGAPSRVSLVPGVEMVAAWEQVRRGASAGIVQVLANVVLLAPMAAVVSLRFRWVRSLGRIALGALVVALSVELGQYAMGVGRISSTDDVLLNTMGAVLGAWIVRARWCRGDTEGPEPEEAVSHAGGEPRGEAA